MTSPNMEFEVLDAIHSAYKNEPDIEIDYLLYLGHLFDNNSIVKLTQLADESLKCLDSMGRCTRCGTPLESYTYKEYHNETDDFCYEELVDWYCPHCDLGRERYLD